MDAGALVRTVRTARMETRYAVFGSGEKNLVILPGMSVQHVTLSAAALQDGFRRFTEEYTVYIFDRRERLPDGFTVEDMADDTADAMDALGIADASVFGASQGGMIAMVLAVRRPELVDRTVIASSSAYLDGKCRAMMEAWADLAKTGLVRELNRSVFAYLYTPAYLETYRDIFASMENDGTAEDLARFAVMADACLKFDFRDRLARIRCPAMVVCGALDTVLGADASRLIAARTGGKLVVYPNYGHAVYDEAPDFREKMWDFFRE